MKNLRIVVPCACAVVAALAFVDGVHAATEPVYLRGMERGWNIPLSNDSGETERRKELINKHRGRIDELARKHADEIRMESAKHKDATIEYGYAIWFDPNDWNQPVKTTSVTKGHEKWTETGWHPSNAFAEVSEKKGTVLAINHSHPAGKKRLMDIDVAKERLPLSGVDPLERVGRRGDGGDIGLSVKWGILCYVTGYDGSLARFDPYMGRVEWLVPSKLGNDIQMAVYNMTGRRLREWYDRNATEAKLGSEKPEQSPAPGGSKASEPRAAVKESAGSRDSAPPSPDSRDWLKNVDKADGKAKHSNLFGDTLK